MNRLYYLLVICACFVGMISCAKEDDLIPSGIVDNYFAVPDNATDEVSILRKNFYEKNGVYLLFNDNYAMNNKVHTRMELLFGSLRLLILTTISQLPELEPINLSI